MPKAVEAVMAGQPDKVCDQVADALVDEFLRRDPQARLDVNVMGANGMLMVAGQAESTADFDCGAFARNTYKQIGYADDVEVFVNLERPSGEMREVGARATDNVVVHGYATRQTREMMPRPVVLAREAALRLDALRGDPAYHWLGPDGKVQLVMQRDRVESVCVLVSHREMIEPDRVRALVLDQVVTPLFGEEGMHVDINPLGPFVTCGFAADAGSSGHKLAVDFYGGLVPHTDSGLSGKDPGKPERCGSYLARLAARWLVGQGLCDAAFVSAAYALGRAEPVFLEARGITEKSRGMKMDLTSVVQKEFDFRPEAIVERLQLKKPVYRQAAVYGQVGREGFPWEDAPLGKA